MSSTPLVVAINRIAPTGSVPITNKKISLVSDENLGAVELRAGGGAGAKTLSLKSRPLWDPDARILNAGGNTTLAGVDRPPFDGLVGRYVVQAVDSAPTPAKVEVYFEIEAAWPAGTLIVDDDYEPNHALLPNNAFTLVYDRKFADDRNASHSYRLRAWKNVRDRRLMIAAQFIISGTPSAAAVAVYPARVKEQEACQLIGKGWGDCSRNIVQREWSALHDALPPEPVL